MNAIDTFRNIVSEIPASDSLNRSLYSPGFYEHLDLLMKPRLVKGDQTDGFAITSQAYMGLKQSAIENSALIEDAAGDEVNWDFVDAARDILNRKIKENLGKEGNSEVLQPLLKFTLDGYEDYLIYDSIHRGSISNPWRPFKDIVHRGILLLGLDSEDVESEFQPTWFSKTTEEKGKRKFAVLAGSSKKKGFGGFEVDQRHGAQALIFHYLKKNSDRNSPKSKKEMQVFLSEKGYAYTQEEIITRITIPLKREGLIGSNTNGFFFVGDQADLEASVDHHLSNLLGIKRTLDVYRRKAQANGWDTKNIPTVSISY
jgi:hypothetical protein